MDEGLVGTADAVFHGFVVDKASVDEDILRIDELVCSLFETEDITFYVIVFKVIIHLDDVVCKEAGAKDFCHALIAILGGNIVQTLASVGDEFEADFGIEHRLIVEIFEYVP